MTSPTDALAILAARHRGEVVRYLTRLLGDAADAEDACQEAFLRAHRAATRLGPDANPRAWLFRIATRTALNLARGRGRRWARGADVAPDSLPAGGATAADQRVAVRVVLRAVEALPPRQRAALLLRRFHGLAYAEVAAAVGGTEATARANVYQAVRRLRLELGGDHP